MNSLLENLTEEQRYLVSQAFGLGTDKPVSTYALSQAQRCSEGKIKVKLEQAMAKLKRIAASTC